MTNQDDLGYWMDRYMKAAHAVQAGVAMTLTRDPFVASPKSLRVGIDLGKAEHGGLAKLLIAKGIFTELEYYQAMAEAAESEKALFEEQLSKELGSKVTLA